MYTKILIPLDGSKTAERVLPYARALAGSLKVPVKLLGVVDIVEMTAHMAAKNARYLDSMVDEAVKRGLEYLRGIATTFPSGSVECALEKGKSEDVIIENGEADPAILIAMATHGRSGVHRWLLGSVAEKVLRGTANALLLVRSTDEAPAAGEVTLKSIIVPLDGSEVAESVLPMVAGLAKKLDLGVVLFRAYSIPYSAYGAGDGYYAIDFNELIEAMDDEAREYLEKKAAELKQLGVKKISTVAKEGLSADQIIRLGHETPDNLIAMCSHGRSGVKRWVLGSVTETVVRHSDHPILVLRPA